ncbi:hypothetical protein CBI38_28590 [Rhodococcus oxybenzonivorans]|uniref:Uncharacterized protein n=1 Tax=Rhodococcus oxybenzonivorans TaxID=1990687 RepID=A0A2S2C237_9NOCA|nr:hypothetical protein CBI38_28590 [Rhodococcus oxybenzonivorans]
MPSSTGLVTAYASAVYPSGGRVTPKGKRPGCPPYDAERTRKGLRGIPTCDTCGNDYDKAFTITRGDRSAVFDSFECASQAMAPRRR